MSQGECSEAESIPSPFDFGLVAKDEDPRSVNLYARTSGTKFKQLTNLRAGIYAERPQVDFGSDSAVKSLGQSPMRHSLVLKLRIHSFLLTHCRHGCRTADTKCAKRTNLFAISKICIMYKNMI